MWNLNRVEMTLKVAPFKFSPNTPLSSWLNINFASFHIPPCERKFYCLAFIKEEEHLMFKFMFLVVLLSLNSAGLAVHYSSFHFGCSKKLIHPRPEDTPETFTKSIIFKVLLFLCKLPLETEFNISIKNIEFDLRPMVFIRLP